MSSSLFFQLLRRRLTASCALKRQTCVRCCSSAVGKSDKSDHKLNVKDTEKIAKEPFMKNVFAGKFDTDLLAFPEVLEPEEIKRLEDSVQSMYNVLDQGTAPTESLLKTQDALKELKELGVFGLQVPQHYGGLNLKATEYARVSEVLSHDVPLAIILAAHQAFGLKGLLTVGSEDQRKQYLPRLACGEWTAAFCLAESSSGVDSSTIGTRAKLSEDGKAWHITGNKMLISSNGIPNLITVIARTDDEAFGGKRIDSLSAFLVENTFPDISVERNIEIIDGRGAHLCEVKFENTRVPVENMLGRLGDGFKISTDVLSGNRFNTGSICAGILKELLEATIQYAINQKQFGKRLIDFESVQEKITNVTLSIYTMESMTYLTAGLLDTYKDADAIVESAIVKVFSSEELVNSIIECQNILGSYRFFADGSVCGALRESRVYTLLEGSNDVLRMFIALSGLQHAGLQLKEMVEKVRNPFMNPGYVFKKMLENRNHARDKPKLKLGLEGHLHPSLRLAAQKLEYCVLKLQHVVEILLTRHGQKITEKEMDLNRLTNVAIGIYAMTAVLARASRSYCIGIYNSDQEIQMATAICDHTLTMVKSNFQQLDFASDRDLLYQKIAKEVIRHKKYCLEHPLTRTFD